MQPVLRKKRCTVEESLINKCITPEIQIKNESLETKDTLDFMIYINAAVFRPVSNYKSKLDPHLTIAIDGKITAKSKTIHHSTILKSPNQE